jgi:hypothetical protein
MPAADSQHPASTEPRIARYEHRALNNLVNISPRRNRAGRFPGREKAVWSAVYDEAAERRNALQTDAGARPRGVLASIAAAMLSPASTAKHCNEAA